MKTIDKEQHSHFDDELALGTEVWDCLLQTAIRLKLIPAKGVAVGIDDFVTLIGIMEERAQLKPVLQDWVCRLSYMQQSVLITNVRGVDGAKKYAPPKMLLRWFRRCVLLSAMDGQIMADPLDPRGGSFTGPSLAMYNPKNYDIRRDSARVVWEGGMEEYVDEYIQECDAIPHHFQMHFLHSAEILGYKHPTPDVRMWWNELYVRLVSAMHLMPETQEQMDRRLGDSRDRWLESNDPATVW